MIKRKNLFGYFLFLLSLCAFSQAKLNKTFTGDDSSALVTLSAYPDSIRPYILEACRQPQALVKAEALQKSTSASFRDLLDDYTKDEQKKLWDLARYPTLMKEISDGGKKSKEELAAIAEKYPAEIRETIKDYGRKHYEVIGQMNALFVNSQKEFANMLNDYPAETRSAYTALSRKPDILNTLSNNMHLAVTLGEMYKNDPKGTQQMMDSVQVDHEKQSAKDLEDWKNGLEKDPQAKQEMEQAAKEFAQENKDVNGNSQVDDVYKTSSEKSVSTPTVQATTPTTTIVNNYYYSQPYPYWFGYPWWYDYPFWYPYPYWYHTGFYWGPAGIVYVGFPSPFYMHWYLYHPYHHYYYSYFTDYCLTYQQVHYGPRHSRTGFNSEIHHWSRANENALPKGYLNPDGKRPERIKELGKFEMDYHNNTKGVFGNNLSRSEFLKNNSGFYPHMKPAIGNPRFNKPVQYPQQQNPVKFNMGNPGGGRRMNVGRPSGGFNIPSAPKSGGGGMRPRK